MVLFQALYSLSKGWFYNFWHSKCCEYWKLQAGNSEIKSKFIKTKHCITHFYKKSKYVVTLIGLLFERL